MSDRPIASTRYDRYIKVECVQMCGWKAPANPLTRDAIRHFKDTGHETAVIYTESVHYHARLAATTLDPGEAEPDAR